MNCNQILSNSINNNYKAQMYNVEAKRQKTNSGLVVGSAVAVLGAAFWLPKFANSVLSNKDLVFLKKMGVDEKGINEIKKQYKHLKKISIPATIISMAVSIGCGILIDRLRDKHSQEYTEVVQKNGFTALYNNSNARIEKGQPYYYSREGRKYGALLGLGCGFIHGLLVNPKKPINLISLGAMALGGYLAGLITDSTANNKTKKDISRMQVFV